MNPMIFIILLVIVIGLRLAIRGAFTKVPRRYRAFAAVLLVALVLAANYYLPARDPVAAEPSKPSWWWFWSRSESSRWERA